jgi:hypothetical protein
MLRAAVAVVMGETLRNGLWSAIWNQILVVNNFNGITHLPEQYFTVKSCCNYVMMGEFAYFGPAK